MKINDLEKKIEDLSGKAQAEEESLNKLKSDYSMLDRTNDELVAKEKLGSLYSAEKKELRKNRDQILKKIKTLDDNERLVVGNFLYNKSVVGFCSGGFGGYKSPTSCGGCHEGENNVRELGLEEYVKFYGDRVYGIPSEIVNTARLALIDESVSVKKADLEKNIANAKSNLDNLNNEKDKIEGSLKVYKKLDKNGVDYERVASEMPDFVEHVKNSEGKRRSVSYVTADVDEKIGIVLAKEWSYNGSGGSEYGVNVIASRDGQTKSEYFKYRDAYSEDKDKPWLDFDEAEIVDVSEDGFDIRLKTHNHGSTAKHYDLRKQERKGLENRLNPEEQREFRGRFEDVKKELVEQHYRKDGIMRDYIELRDSVSASVMGASGNNIPYHKPEVVDEYINPANGEGVVVIKAQIDHHAGRGLQHEWVAYKVSETGNEMLSRDCAYQLEFKHGKIIEMKASEIYNKMKD